MVSPQYIRIFPVLIIVAMLAFSVRLIDFASGVSSFSGAAQATEAQKAPVTPADGETPPDQSGLSKAGEPVKMAEADAKEAPAAPSPKQPDALEKGDKKTEMSSEEKTVAVKEEKTEKSEPQEWRDAGDEEPGTQNTKMEVLKDLSARREGLEKKEQELQTREALLRAAEQEIDRKYQELSSLRKELELLLDKQSDEEKARIASLVKIYEGMKPKEAARIFDTLDIKVLMSVMSRMSERKLSPIMASMNPERAKTMTIMLAEEKTLPTLPPADQ